MELEVVMGFEGEDGARSGDGVRGVEERMELEVVMGFEWEGGARSGDGVRGGGWS